MENELRNLIRYFSLLGICVCEVQYETRTSIYVRCQNVCKLFYPFVLVLVLCSCWWLGTHNDKYDNGFVLSWVVSTFVLIAQLLAHLLIIYEAVNKKHSHNDFLRCLNQIEEHLKFRLRLQVQRHALMKRLKRTLCILLTSSVSCLFVFLIAVHIMNDYTHYYFGIFSSLAMRLRLLQLWLYVRILSTYLDFLNQKLLQVVSCKNETLLDISEQQLQTLESLEMLEAIRDTYNLLYEAVQHINDFSGWSVWMIISSCTLDYTCHIYWWLLTLDDMLPGFTYLTSVLTLLPLGATVCKYCIACSDCKKEFERFILMLNRLLLLRGRNKCLAATKAYRSFIGDFLLQLQHQRIEFNANHFFNIDLKLLMTISVSISTYLIILIQFLNDNVSA